MQTLDYRERVYSNYLSSLGKFTVDDRSRRAPYLRNLIRHYFPVDRAARILDLGCGSGTLLHYLYEAGYTDVQGVDSSSEQVAAAEAMGIPGVRREDLFHALAATADDSFEVVTSFDVIEHLTKGELLHFADEVYRVLQPGGRWIIHTPNADSPFGAGQRYRDWTHEQAFTSTSIAQLSRVACFRRLDCYEDQPVAHGVRSLVRRALWKVIRTTLQLYIAAETGSTGSEWIFSQNLLAIAYK